MKPNTVPSGLKNQIAVLYSAVLSEISLEQKLVYVRSLLGSLKTAAELTGNRKYIAEINAGIKILDDEVRNVDNAGEEASHHEMFRKINRIQDFITKVVFDPTGYADFSGSDRFVLIKPKGD